jgi:A/G-specific adenine glycosylase
MKPPARSRRARPFAQRLLRWHDRHGRHDLPWQHPRTAYRVWLSEIMLQQTQVATVIPYYRRFLERFPDVGGLAAASLDDVLALWAGLGYYARARNLHRAARVIVEQYGGEFPRTFESVSELPGIGRSTAGAILAQAFGQRHAILDGNVRRVLARHAAIGGWPGEPRVAEKLWREADRRLPRSRLADYTQALMDLGATLCTTRAPQCARCPVAADCVALRANRVARLPAPRPVRDRPRRNAQLLLIENGRGDLLLERRPERGIWGGLWCPPMMPAPRAARAYCAQLDAVVVRRLPVVRHGFTHFDLSMRPLLARAASTSVDAGSSWIPRADLARYGIPAPVRELLQTLG